MPDRRPIVKDTEPGKCPIQMSDRKACGRPILGLKPAGDEFSVCLMHSHDMKKNITQFENEIQRIINDTSPYSESLTTYDFSFFVFPIADFFMKKLQKRTIFVGSKFIGFSGFQMAEFLMGADFSNAVFNSDVHFDEAWFSENTHFNDVVFKEDAIFTDTRFHGSCTFESAQFNSLTWFDETYFGHNTSFRATEFNGETRFYETTFEDEVIFTGSTFKGSVLYEATRFKATIDLRHVDILPNANVRFMKINNTSPHEAEVGEEDVLDIDPEIYFRAYFLDSPVERIVLEDINWFRQNRRLTLQDEINVHRDYESRRQHPDELSYIKPDFELTKITYLRLVNNFERTRQYDLAEDCFIGAMEMKRLDPNQPRGARYVAELYRFASEYGSNYTRAVVVLFGLLGFFGILYSLPGFGLTPTSDMAFLEGPYLESGYSWQRLLDGILYAFEVITFTREPTFTVTNYLGKAVRIAETILIPGQLALFFLALRRRFRR